jgi:hypothetical protein
MFKPVLFAIFFLTQTLQAQETHCVVYTRSNDTLPGFVRFKGHMELQNEGMAFISRSNKERMLLPSQIKEATIYLDVLKPLRVVSIPKSFISQFIDIEKIDTSKDSHILVKTDTSSGPLQFHAICTGYSEKYYPGSFKPMTVYTPGFVMRKEVYTEFISLNFKWTRLPDSRFYRNDVLMEKLSDCPALMEKLKKDRINPMKKMDKILSMYNQCKKP